MDDEDSHKFGGAGPLTWDADGLRELGFKGFAVLENLDPHIVPEGRGVYAVLRGGIAEPFFLEQSIGLNLRSYDVGALHRRWLCGAQIVYIGKAGGRKGLRERLRQFSKLLRSHSGGRAIWQLADASQLRVAWFETLTLDPGVLEDRLHSAFWLEFGALPFANINLSKRARAMIDDSIRPALAVRGQSAAVAAGI